VKGVEVDGEGADDLCHGGRTDLGVVLDEKEERTKKKSHLKDQLRQHCLLLFTAVTQIT